MNSPQLGLRIASVVFGLVGFAHAVRLLAETPVRVGTYFVPIWVSVVAMFLSGALSMWCWQLAASVKRTG